MRWPEVTIQTMSAYPEDALLLLDGVGIAWIGHAHLPELERSYRPFRAPFGRTVVVIEIDTHFDGIVGVEWVMQSLLVVVKLFAAEFRVRDVAILAESVRRNARRPATQCRKARKVQFSDPFMLSFPTC